MLYHLILLQCTPVSITQKCTVMSNVLISGRISQLFHPMVQSILEFRTISEMKRETKMRVTGLGILQCRFSVLDVGPIASTESCKANSCYLRGVTSRRDHAPRGPPYLIIRQPFFVHPLLFHFGYCVDRFFPLILALVSI